MDRQNKGKVFPKWNPNWRTYRYINQGEDRKLAFKKFRNSSSSFINRKDVREIIFEKCSQKCVNCKSEKSLQIDHIDSVYFCFHNNKIDECNVEKNLQVLCYSCNTSKAP